jgi:hypothetical protein
MTEAQLQQGFRALADRARREPVTITTSADTTPDGRDELVVLSAEEYARLKRRDRRVGLTEEWVEAVRNAKVPDEFAALRRRAEIARACRCPRPFRALSSAIAIFVAQRAPGGARARRERSSLRDRSWRRYARPMTPAAGEVRLRWRKSAQEGISAL